MKSDFRHLTRRRRSFPSIAADDKKGNDSIRRHRKSQKDKKRQNGKIAKRAKKIRQKRSFHRELLKLNFRIALSNDNKRLTEIHPRAFCHK